MYFDDETWGMFNPWVSLSYGRYFRDYNPTAGKNRRKARKGMKVKAIAKRRARRKANKKRRQR
jgi:hypothetical protein